MIVFRCDVNSPQPYVLDVHTNEATDVNFIIL